MTSFEKSTYLSQVRRLRILARAAIRDYSVKVKRLEFINHGENATFCVHAVGGKKYLLRILRGGYHTEQAVDAELRWLSHLAQKGFAVPKPVRSKNKTLTIFARTAGVADGRKCALFEWVDGTFIAKSINERHMYEVGVLLARIQKSAPKGLAKHRRYWTAEGLVGRSPKFGSVESLAGVGKSAQSSISRARPLVFSKLRSYEKRFPKRQGFIHADLHFGNIILHKGKITAIDFDDSGLGFFAYDLVIPLLSAKHHLGKKRAKEFPKLRAELIRGYSENAAWDAHDEGILSHLTAARRIAMLGWLNSRSDNPRLKSYLKKTAKEVATYLTENY